jgi:hypothetical protein
MLAQHSYVLVWNYALLAFQSAINEKYQNQKARNKKCLSRVSSLDYFPYLKNIDRLMISHFAVCVFLYV